MSQAFEIYGYCDERFNNVKEVFAENFKSGLEVGASLAATLNGEFVIDLWAGYTDAAKTHPWERDTIVNVFSTTKVMTALCALMLVDRGLLDLDAPVAEYWPEFAQAGKKKMPVRYLLSHSSGLSGFGENIPVEALYDWDRIINMLAAQKPWWEPGTQSGYHVFTFGYLVGELIRRVTGKTVGTFFRDEVALLLKADFHIGLPEEHDPRVAELIPPKRTLLIKIFTSRLFQKLLSFNIRMKSVKPLFDMEVTKTRAWRGAEIPAANGHGNARSIARIGAALACGGELDGVRILSASTIEKAIEEQVNGKDKVLGTKMRFGLGWGLPSTDLPYQFPNPRTFFWGGYGGSLCAIDLDAKLSIGYAMNKMYMEVIGDPRTQKLYEALIKAYNAL